MFREECKFLEKETGKLLPGKGWQDKVITEIPNLEYFDPRSHELQNPNQYAIWDTHHVRRADILFAYMEKDNPSGYGLATEIGYARSLGKTVILVDERSQVDEQFRRHFAIVRELSDVVLESLDAGIALLRKFASDVVSCDKGTKLK